MDENQKISKVISLFGGVTRFPPIYQPIFTVDKPMRWLLADYKNQYVSFFKRNNEQNLLNVDVTSCFPTICKYLFSESNPDFVDQIYNLTDKKARNILISTTLKQYNYIKILNIISKMVILSYVFDRNDSDKVSLIEFEKDGVLIFTDSLDYYDQIKHNIIDSPILDFINLNEFKFHINKNQYYIRNNNTSIIVNDENEIRLKGMYKNTPEIVREFYVKVFNGENINEYLNIFSKIYNRETFHIIKKQNLDRLFRKYYICGEDNILNINRKYEKANLFKNEIDPLDYLRVFVYPIMLFTKMFNR